MHFRKCAILAVFLVAAVAYSFAQVSTRNELAAASAAEKAGRYSEAAKHYEDFLAATPPRVPANEIANARLHLAIDQFMAHCYQESLHALVPLIESASNRTRDHLPAKVWIIAGLDELELNKLDNAIRDLRWGLLADPASGTARLALGDALARSGHLVEAIHQYREQAKRTPAVVEVWYKIGMAEEVLAKISRKQFEQTNSESPISRLLEAHQSLERDDGLGAARILLPLASQKKRRSASLSADFFPGVHSSLGEALLDEGYLRAAQQEFQRELTGNPASAPAYFGLAEIDTLDSHWDAFRSRVHHLMIFNPHYLENRLTKRPPAPLRNAWTSNLLRVPPTMAETTEVQLWISWIKANGISRVQIEPQRQVPCTAIPGLEASTPGFWLPESCAVDLSKELESKHSPSPTQIAKLAEIEFQLGHFEKAQDAAMRAANGGPPGSLTSEWGTYWLIRSAEALSLAAFEKAAAINPNAPRVRQLLAQNYADHLQWGKAIEEYQAALRLSPHLVGLHFGLGTVYWQAGDWKEAQVQLQQTLQISPESTVAAYELGDTDVNLHQWKEALPYLRKAVADPETSRQARIDIAKVESELGRYQEALAELKVLANDDQDGQIHFRMGLLYRKMGETEKASQAFAESQRLHLARDAATVTRMEELEQDRARLKEAQKEISE